MDEQMPRKKSSEAYRDVVSQRMWHRTSSWKRTGVGSGMRRNWDAREKESFWTKEQHVSKQEYQMGNPGLRDCEVLFIGAMLTALSTYSEHRHQLTVFKYSCQQCILKHLYFKKSEGPFYVDYICQHLAF